MNDHLKKTTKRCVIVRSTVVVLFAVGLIRTALAAEPPKPYRIQAEEFGLQADGISDDGPSIERMLQAAASAERPTRIVFPQNKTIRITTANERYAFRFHRVADVSIDGNGCTFLLGPNVRFLRVTSCANFSLRNLNVDFDPLPFAEGTVIASSPDKRTIDVRLQPTGDKRQSRLLPVGGPTREDGEQAFFGMVWHPGPYGLLTHHYWIERMELLTGHEPLDDASPIIRATTNDRFRGFADIRPGTTQASLPIPGIAHRFGPGSCFEIWDNDGVLLEDVELWSAPWFGFRVFRNRGEVIFRRVNIRPKPGSGRLSSTWRDGFHVKGNSARLLWEDCMIAGTHDDAFNISHHCSRVQQVISPTKIIVQQTFPLNVMPWHEGELLTAANHDTGTLLGQSVIRKVILPTEQRMIGEKPAASPVTLELEEPLLGLTRGIMVWEPAYANPDTTLRRCRIEQSCRLQSPVLLDSCDVTALLWFYSERIEGPFPSSVTVRGCKLRRGRGNRDLSLSFVGRSADAAGPSAIRQVVLKENEIWGAISAVGVDDLRIEGNTFHETAAAIRLRNNRSVNQQGNRDANGAPLPLSSR